MRKTARVKFAVIAALLAMSLAAPARTLTVLAAASLREAFTEIARVFEAKHPGDQVRLSFAGSQQLAASILLDAPADVFASADEIQMNRVIAAGKAGAASTLCSNRLVIAVNKQAALRVRKLADLAQPNLIVILAKQVVPAGAYTEKLFARLPSSEAAAINANVRSRESDVRTVLARVALGEADAGIVYATDVSAAQDSVVSVPIGLEVQTPVAYMISALSRSPEPSLAAAFVKLTLSPRGQSILRTHGFLPPPRPRL